jgi:hypothetical protein
VLCHPWTVDWAKDALLDAFAGMAEALNTRATAEIAGVLAHGKRSLEQLAGSGGRCGAEAL